MREYVKPRIHKAFAGLWVCKIPGRQGAGVGVSPSTAYNDWINDMRLRQLIEGLSCVPIVALSAEHVDRRSAF